MLHPCDNCGGDGIGACPADTDGDGNCAACARQSGTHICVACKDMPWLKCKHGRTEPHWRVVSDFEYEAHTVTCEGRWKPDPSTVMGWCQIHRCGAALGYDMCFGEIREPPWHRSAKYCNIVWIEKPTALKEAT